jgi:tRNA threonylcarbamoyladenosine biosynthesis protein TsaB
MTNTLVVDTSFGSTVGVLGHNPIVETDSRTHVERLQVNIGKAVESAGLEPGDLDNIIVGVGPAPFTGLRAGVVAAKAISYATGAKLIGQDALSAQACMLSLKRQGDQRLSGTPFLRPVERCNDNDSARHLTLAVNDARRRQLYFALYDEPVIDVCSDAAANEVCQQEAAQHHRVNVRELMTMDIDYPQHIVERIHETLNDFAATSDSEESYCIDIVGHGATKYTTEWQELDEMLGCVIEASVLDAGAVGLEIFAECALCANGISGNKEGHSRQNDSAENDHIKPVEPLYLRRPDVSVPNPLKHVLNHAAATRA